MKILSIRLKNLASLEGSFDIDFTVEPLASAGIFAISGPTGAGKSTILDALCLALYDRAPRFSASSENLYLKDVGDSEVNQSDVKNILRHGAGDGFAEVLFLATNGFRYLSRWTVRRARGKSTGSLQPQILQVRNLDTEEELQGTKTELLTQLVVLIGLTYEQFTRTVLLAQNDFATFLKSRESAKAELLEKLTGTEIYSEISRSVFAHSKSATEVLNQLKSNISLIELLPDEELRLLGEERAALADQRSVAVKRLSLLNDQLKMITTLAQQQRLLAKKRDEEVSGTERLKKAEGVLAEQLEKQQTFKRQCEVLQPELRNARELDIQIRTVQHTYSEAERGYRTLCKRKEEVHKVLLEKETALSREWLKLGVDRDVSVLSGEERLEQATALLLTYDQQLEVLQKANDERAVKLNAFDIRSLGEEQHKLAQDQKGLQNARQRVSEWLKLQKEAERLVCELAELDKVKLKAEEELRVSGELLQAKDGQVKTFQRLYENLRMAMSRDVEAIRSHLAQGEACPVCGAKEHPYAEGEAVVDSVYRNVEREYQVASDEYLKLNNRCIALERDREHLFKQREALAVQLTVVQKEIAIHTPEKEEERDVACFDVRLEQLQQQSDRLSDRLKAYQQFYEEWQRYDKEIKDLRRRNDGMREVISACRVLFQQVASGKEQLAMAEISEKEEHVRFVAVRDELERLSKERSALLKGKSVDDAEAAVLRYEKDLSALLEASRIAVDEQKKCIFGVQGEIKQLLSGIEELVREKERIESPDGLPEAIRVQQAAGEEVDRKLSSVEARLLQQEQNRLKLKGIADELKEKQGVAEQWEKLNKLIGSADGSKFKVIAQSYTLNLLLMHANKHLSYLSKRYKLQQVPNSLALQVIDCDMCDRVRTVYSLSGGESFLVSLALALGLSSLSSNNLKVESLFIDEGFGSLDAESLRTAMEALEQLQMQGRKIGVISHVQEMSERISVQVRVHKLVNGKSRIEIISS